MLLVIYYFSAWITIFLSTPISPILLSDIKVYVDDSSNILAYKLLDPSTSVKTQTFSSPEIVPPKS